MRSTCSLYVDAGYLLAAAATRVTGTSLRSGIHVDYPALIRTLIDTAEGLSGEPVLRVHWYDSARNGVPDAQQERIGELSKVKLRLGRFGVNGEQKGVDLRMGLDLVNHARKRVSDVFYLVSGDDDLTEAVEAAQFNGIQVTLLAVPTTTGAPHGVSRHLIRAADEIDTIDGEALDAAALKIDRAPCPSPDPVSTPPRPAPRPSPAAASPPLPSPAAVASPSRPSPPAPRPAPRELATAFEAPSTSSVLAYSSSTGTPSQDLPYYADDHADDVIDTVARRVLASFQESANYQDKVLLRSSRPSIPREIDRALLQDASDLMQIYDLDEGMRHQLRTRFWEIYDGS